jgi:predicted aspartyl protease
MVLRDSVLLYGVVNRHIPELLFESLLKNGSITAEKTGLNTAEIAQITSTNIQLHVVGAIPRDGSDLGMHREEELKHIEHNL